MRSNCWLPKATKHTITIRNNFIFPKPKLLFLASKILRYVCTGCLLVKRTVKCTARLFPAGVTVLHTEALNRTDTGISI